MVRGVLAGLGRADDGTRVTGFLVFAVQGTDLALSPLCPSRRRALTWLARHICNVLSDMSDDLPDLEDLPDGIAQVTVLLPCGRRPHRRNVKQGALVMAEIMDHFRDVPWFYEIRRIEAVE